MGDQKPNYDHVTKTGFSYLKRGNIVCSLFYQIKKPISISLGRLVILKKWKYVEKKTRLRTVHDRKHLKIRGFFEDKFINSCFSFCKISRKDMIINFHIPNHLKSSHKKMETNKK